MSVLQLEAEVTTVGAAAAELVVPTKNIVIACIVAVILVAAGVAGFLILKRHAQNWGNALVYGLLAGVGFIALFPMLLSALLTLVPAWANYLTTNDKANQYISLGLQFIVTLAAFTVGMVLLKRSSEKTHQKLDLSSGIMFGFGIFLVGIFIGQQLSFCTQYVPFAISVNKAGYEEAIASAVTSGMTQEEAVDYLKNISGAVDTGFLYVAIAFLFKGVIEIFAGGVSYGLITGRLEKKYYAWLVCGMVFIFGTDLVFYITQGGNLLYMIALAVLAAVYAVVSVMIFKKDLPDEWKDFKVIKKGTLSGFPRKDRTPPKMPKIQMPKE